MNNTVIADIKQRGYWRINFRPVSLEYSISDLSECLNLITKNKVYLRGWSCPYVPLSGDAHKDIVPGNAYYEGWINSGMHRELWRMYQSTQFIHYLSLREDWQREDKMFGDENGPTSGSALSIIGTVYQITEIYELLRRLVAEKIYEHGMEVQISLNNTKNRKLWLNDPMRAPLFAEYTTGAEIISYSKSYQKDEVLLHSKEFAFECIIHIFKRFGWNQPNETAIRNDQDKLLSGRI